MADGNRNLLVGDQVFEHDLGGFVFDHRAPRVAVELLHFFQLLDDNRAQLLLRAENGFSAGSFGARPVVLMSIFLPPKYATKLSRASARLALPRMIAITLSR